MPPILLLMILLATPSLTGAFLRQAAPVSAAHARQLNSRCRGTTTTTFSFETDHRGKNRQVSSGSGAPTSCASLANGGNRAACGSQTLRMSAVEDAERAGVDAASCSVEMKTWKWQNYHIRYKVAGQDSAGPPMVLIHGFGGNADHWRKNMDTLAKTGPVYAIDLLGYGFSSKPDPGPWTQKNSIYNFETWSQQVLDFAKEVVGDKVFLVCNSVGGVVGLQAGVDANDEVLGVVILNISLRMLHEKKQSPLGKPFVTGLQYVLRESPVGSAFFGSVAKAKAVSNILKQCYGDPDQVTDELVDCILTPGLEPGAVKVFLDFLSYSGGPLPEELLPKITVPVLIGWGDQDPWEPIELGRAYSQFESVEDFVTLPGAGHCPMDEAPHLVNPLIVNFVEKHASR